MTHLHVDFTKRVGMIKPVHGMNNCARDSMWGDLAQDFKDLNVPIIRLHDTGAKTFTATTA